MAHKAPANRPRFIEKGGLTSFGKHFHLLLNSAVVGSWPVNVSEKGVDESRFPNQMQVDYVRVFACSVDTKIDKGCATHQDTGKQIKGVSK